ncbi:hypothetical protein HBI42_025630 [Parastagonospora nodorum]|nr:hypothetical protein HBI32_043470 [Parastagonospora nodorum]KAH6270865.1 hypothetical protein HBI42_025630 [Parastagonospora nodorum]
MSLPMECTFGQHPGLLGLRAIPRFKRPGTKYATQDSSATPSNASRPLLRHLEPGMH